MSTDISGGIADRQRTRASRRASGGGAAPPAVSPPRQRRPALAALALLLIVGGALVAGLLAVRVDSRVPVLVAARDIEPGSEITAEDLTTARVASEGLDFIDEEHADQVVGAYSVTGIPANTVLDERMVSTESPIDTTKAIVSVPLDPKLTPADDIRSGDLVQVVRASGASGDDGKAEEIATALILSVSTPSADDLGTTQVSSASLLVPAEAAASVIDAASAGEAGLAILAHGQKSDVELEVSSR